MWNSVCLDCCKYLISMDWNIFFFSASRIGENCDGETRCISEYASCNSGICTCLQGFLPTNDGRCKLPGTSFVGEECGTCEYPAECSSGLCKCAEKFRPLTIDEFWLDPLNMLQCRPTSYHMGKDNIPMCSIPIKYLV